MVKAEAEPLITTLEISTPGRGFQDITGEVQGLLGQCAEQTGICHLFLRHTSASLLITENADPDVRRDLETFMSRVVPDGDPAYLHSMEGPDDMPAHIRSVLTCSELTVPIRAGKLGLGTWQGIYLWEHRARPHRRRIDITVIPGSQ